MILLVLMLILFLLLFSANPGLGAVMLIALVIFCAIAIQDSSNRTEAQKEQATQNQEQIEKRLEELNFKEDKELCLTLNSISPKMKIDTHNKQIALCDYNKDELKIIPFQNLLECQIVEDNTTILEGGVGRAVVGGALAGGAGAIVGATTRKSKDVTKNLSIKIITSDLNDSLIVIPILETTTNRESDKYKKAWTIAQETHATISSIIKTFANHLSVEPIDPLSQIETLSRLKEQGVLTEEEFSKKKAELLSKV